MKRLFFLAALFAVLAASRGPALLAAGAEDLAAVALMPALKGKTDGVGLPACGNGADIDGATRWLRAAEALDGGPAGRRLVRRGWRAWLGGDCTEAEAAWAEACANPVSPSVAPACLQLLLRTEGEMGSVPRGGAGAGEMAEGAYRHGLWAEQADAESQARFAHALSLGLDPNREAAERLARLYREEGRTEGAIGVWEALAAALPAEDEDHWWALGRAAGLRERWGNTAAAYGRGAVRAKQPYSFWIAQGDAFRQAQQWADAEQSYRQALNAQPESPAPYERLGHVQRAQEDFAGARRSYTEAARIDPDRVPPWYYVGVAHYQDDDLSQAQAAFEKALTIDPTHAASTYYLARCLQRSGDLVEAADTLAQAVELHGREPWDWARQLGDWRRDLGNREGALEAYSQALAWRPDEEWIEKRIEELIDTES